jgi:hypothetical protein
MSLSALQAEFTETLGRFLVWCEENDYPVIIAEVFRTKEQAAIYKAAGKGILNSAHCKKLAADLFRVVDGTVSWDREEYRIPGGKWKTMHELARWGGDWPRRDAVHFSFEYKGVK